MLASHREATHLAEHENASVGAGATKSDRCKPTLLAAESRKSVSAPPTSCSRSVESVWKRARIVLSVIASGMNRAARSNCCTALLYDEDKFRQHT